MIDNYQICPYTGLRSFSEDESLYFKGREEDIDQATSQLQKNKFLMLTGASGDGKSSLVFAGIIPNARAGFLKSKNTNWCVAQFRPERTPFQNLCQALAKQLEIPNFQTVEGELNHGFSALTDLYKNSRRNIDFHSTAWLQADNKTRAAMKRDAANLIILVDQFEEFFTNPENYHHGAPSREANLVLNLLLETARIALEEDLPVYVVFTMRSDYIGQCAAFRGLPEYIGFSQFFVPRLNRSQLRQVIEEPAVLSGNQIARRLTERLIHDLTEGVDQLPILQHALKQIWIAADSGKEEMDLLHYAMVGGMSVEELPPEQVNKFNSWFSSLPEEIKACYHQPSLQNVLDTHTNKLYEEAGGYYKEKTDKSISGDHAKQIIRNAFTCLTKIDQGRAVRNRMTLREITQILGDPAFDHETVGEILNIFREPGNTFINPFITEDPESRKMHPDTILDITHESLIRNWQYLEQWAKEEFDSHTVSLDFEKQLDRWVNSGRSNNYLLSIGPLTYFENWYRKARPNAWWIARYLPEETKKENRLQHAGEILDNSRAFIQRSASKHAITRTIMRYGPKRIAVVLGILAILILSSFALRDHFKKQNEYVLKSIQEKSLILVSNPKVDLTSKAILLTEMLKSGTTNIDEIQTAIKDTILKISSLNRLSSLLIFQGRTDPKKEIDQFLLLTDSLLEWVGFPENDPVRLSSILTEINQFRVVLELAYFYRPEPDLERLKNRNARRSARWVKNILNKQPPAFHDIHNFSQAFENAINYQAFSQDELKKYLALLSPFENGLQSDWLKSNYQKDNLLTRGWDIGNYGFLYNGLYQELAYIYAATGESGKALRCLDSLLANSEHSFQGDYGSVGDNASNIAAVYFQYDHQEALNAFVQGYCLRKKISEEEFYNRMIGRTFHGLMAAGNLRLYPWMTIVQNLNLQFASRNQLEALYDKYRKVAGRTSSNADEKNFLFAVSYKNQAIQSQLYSDSIAENGRQSNDLFQKAFSYYHSVSPKYLEAAIPITESSVDSKLAPRKTLFIYPDIRTAFHPSEPRSYFYFFFGHSFLKYIMNHQLFEQLYSGADELKNLEEWINNFNTLHVNFSAFLINKPEFSFLKNLENELEKKKAADHIDLNWLYLYLGKEAQDSGQMDLMLSYYDKIDRSNIFNTLRSKELFGYIRDQSFRLIGFCVEGYLKTGHLDRAHKIILSFKNPVNRSSLYAFAAVRLLNEKFPGHISSQAIDSAEAELKRKENISNGQPNRRQLAYALVLEDPNDSLPSAYNLIRNLPAKYSAIQDVCRALAFRGKLFDAQYNIPDFISGTDEADFLSLIIRDYTNDRQSIPASWQKFVQWYLPLFNLNIQYIDENS